MSSTTQTAPKIKKSWGEAIKAYLDHRALFLLFLGFAAGLPILLVYSNIGIWLREAGLELSLVTMFSWAALGYSFKFIWAPLIDSLPVPILSKWLGRRRAWMLVAQFGVIGAILTIANMNPVNEQVFMNLLGYEITPLVVMAMGAVLLGFSSATQDIVIDAYRIDVAPSELQPILSSTYIVGYRIGMIVASAGALYMATYFGSTKEVYSYEAWRNTYYVLAGVMSIAVLTTLTVYEPKSETTEPKQQKKQKLNQTVMAIYSALVLIPGSIYGAWHLLNKLFTKVFDSNIFNIPEVVIAVAVKYGMGLTVFIPIALLVLIINQPKFRMTENFKVTEDKNDYLRLVSVFFFSVLGFIFTFRSISTWMPDIEDKFFSFGASVILLLISLVIALLIGFVLVKVGLVKEEIAMRVWVNPIKDFFNRYGKKALLLLGLIGLYRISDIVAGTITGNLYQDMGFSKIDIANASKFVGLIMTITGGFLGGLLTQKMSMMRAMMVGAILASATNLLFILLTMNAGSLPYLYFAVIIDNLAAGLASAVFIAFLSALTSIRFTAVQYAIFSSLMTLIPKVLGGYSGTIVDSIGYSAFFWFTFGIGLPILVLIWLVDKKLEIGEPKIGDK